MQDGKKRFEDLITDSVQQSTIGPAWRLFLMIYYQSDEQGFLKLSHKQIARHLDANIWSIRYWRRYLSDQNVIDSIANSRYVFFHLKSPWLEAKLNENPVKKEESN